MNRVFLTIAFFIPLVFVFGCADESASGREKVPVTVFVLEPSMISETVNAPCRLEAGSEAVVSVSVPSVVEEVLVIAGDTVVSGQRLLVLGNDDMQRAAVCNAAAMLTAARASSEYSHDNLRRASELLDTGAMSADEFDRIQTISRASEATYRQALAGYTASSTSARNGFVLAPFDGVIGRVFATQGNLATGPLLSITGTTVIKAELLVAPRHIQKLRVGLPAVFTTDHFPGRIFPASVVSVSETADVISGLVSLTIQITDSTSSLLPGLSGMTLVSLETRENAIVLPGSMMTYVNENEMEVMVVENGYAIRRTVQTGLRNGISYEITEGLSMGDSVINLGHTLVSEEALVRVVQR